MTQLNIKGSIVDSNNRLNSVFPNCFSFHYINRKCKESRKAQTKKLDKLIFIVSTNSKTAIIISDTSIKNQIATLTAHIHVYDKSIIKTLHHAINVTSIEAKLFAIRYGIN